MATPAHGRTQLGRESLRQDFLGCLGSLINGDAEVFKVIAIHTPKTPLAGSA